MQQPTDEPTVLPERSNPLGLDLSFPLSSLASIQRGFESQ